MSTTKTFGKVTLTANYVSNNGKGNASHAITWDGNGKKSFTIGLYCKEETPIDDIIKALEEVKKLPKPTKEEPKKEEPTKASTKASKESDIANINRLFENGLITKKKAKELIEGLTK